MSLKQAVIYSLASLGLIVWGLIEGIPVWKSWIRGKWTEGDVFGWAGIPFAILFAIAFIAIWVKYFQGR